MQTNNWNTYLDMCQVGLRDPYTKLPYRHRTKLVHNSYELHKALSRLCPGHHSHEVTQGSTTLTLPDGATRSIDKTRFAGWYTPEFCNAVITPLERELKTPVIQRQRHFSQRSFSTYPTVLMDPDQYPEHQCPHCGKPYRSHSGLADHLEKVHRIIGPQKRRKLDAEIQERLDRDRREREHNPFAGMSLADIHITKIFRIL